MQLNKLKLSIVTCTILATSNILADDYVSIQYMNYDEDSGKTTITSPHLEINKDFGVDYSLNLAVAHDTVTGASPIYYDTSSGATTKLPSGSLLQNDVRYDYVKYEDDRKAYGATITKRFKSRDELTLGVNHSTENDYESNEMSAEYLYYLSSSKNQSLSFGVSSQNNDILVYCDANSQICDGSSGASQKTMDLKVMSSEIGFTQIIDKTSLLKSSIFAINEDGYLSNPYMRVVRDYNTNPKITEDSKPDTRVAYGVMFQYSKALSNTIATNSSYKYYQDDWGIASNTVSLEGYYQFNSKLTFGVGGRFYTQSKADFYSEKRDYFTDEKYASSDARMSDFESVNYMLSTVYKIYDDLNLNCSINYYEQLDYFDSTYYNIGLKYKF